MDISWGNLAISEIDGISNAVWLDTGRGIVISKPNQRGTVTQSVKNIRESAGEHATQRRRVCNGVVRMKNETNERYLCLSSQRGGDAVVLGVRQE